MSSDHAPQSPSRGERGNGGKRAYAKGKTRMLSIVGERELRLHSESHDIVYTALHDPYLHNIFVG